MVNISGYCLGSTKLFIILIVVHVIGTKFLICYYCEKIPQNGQSEHKHEFGKTTVNKKQLSLRYDWTSLEPLSAFSKQINFHQNNQCHLPLANFRYRNRFGLGSDLHLWSQAICNGLETGYRIRTVSPWLWNDESNCMMNDDRNREKLKASAMTCYFPKSELLCPNDVNVSLQEDMGVGVRLYNLTRGKGKIRNECPNVTSQHGISEIRAASTEFLFTGVSPLIQQEAERQLNLVFGHRNKVPNNLITVHIRWGDKKDEVKLVPIEKYIEAVKTLLSERQKIDDDADDAVHIFLATEDPKAVQAFRNMSLPAWNIYVDVYFQELNPFRKNQYNGNPMMAKDLNGKPGLIALGSLLVAMEANDFVLTTASNWSLLMNEIRKNILEARCNCTRFIDLLEGKW